MTVRSATATFAIATIAAILILTAGPAAAQSPGTSPAPSFGTAPALSPADAVKGFSIVLVEGSLQPGTSSELPAPAKAAIDDIKDFLPFKSYQLLDASWMLGATDVKSRLRGGDRYYDVAVTVQPDVKNLSVKFVLRDAVSQAVPALSALTASSGTVEFLQGQLESLRARISTESAQLEALRQRLDQKHPDILKAEYDIARDRDRLLQLERRLEAAGRAASEQQRPVTRTADAALIDTSFSMRLGETVVVGTSRVNGERALIALMTAVSKEPVVVRRQF